MHRRPEDEGAGLFLGMGLGIATGSGFGVALDNIALGIAICMPPGTAVWISKHGNDGDG